MSNPGAETNEPIGGRFRVEREIGAGGMGTVYRAIDTQTGEPVALKLLRAREAADLERFARESRILSELSHPHVVRYLAHGLTVTGEPYLAMEWLEGEDLADRLNRAPLSMHESVVLAQKVASALAAAHDRGIIHRDVKPANIFLPGGSIADARVLDFGIARTSRDAALTRTGSVIGTVGYMAPEQLRGERNLDARADVFALGCVLMECLTRRPLYTGEHLMAVATKILLEDAPRLLELEPAAPAPLDELCARMLMRDRTRRIATASEVESTLRGLESLATLHAPSAGARPGRAALGKAERRVVSVIIADTAAADPNSAAADATITPEHLGALHAALVAAAEPFGASVEMPGQGAAVALLMGEGTPVELATRAARCALSMRAKLPDAPLVLVTGLCVVAGRIPLGPVVDRAFSELAVAPREGVRIDDLTASLIDEHFEVTSGPAGLVLLASRKTETRPRMLLGRPTPCVGRDRELGTLAALLDECVAEDVSRVALVTAPPGMGKSRLLRELVQGARQRTAGLRVLSGHGDAVAPDTAFGLLSRVLRGAAGVIEAEPTDARRARISAFVELHLPEAEHATVAPFVGELAGVPFDEAASVELRAARSDPAIMSEQLSRALTRVLSAMCDDGPLLLLLEDLHWADATSIREVDRMLDTLRERPFMVLASARPEIEARFPGLFKARAPTELTLAGLSRRAGEKLVRAVLGTEMADADVARLVERAGGNAFFLEELVRCAAEGRADVLPTSMIGMVQMRLADLEDETRGLLRAASIIGETFWADAAAHLSGASADAVRARVDDLVARELCSRSTTSAYPGTTELMFRHALVREVAYETLTDDDRRLGHKLAGEWLESHGARDAALLAAHFERGGEPGIAASWYLRAASDALEVNDLDGALALAGRGLLQAPDQNVEAELHRCAGRAHRWKGELPGSSASLGRAFELFPAGGTSWFLTGGDLVNVVARQTQLENAAAITRRLLATPFTGDAGGKDGTVRLLALARATHLIAYPFLHETAEPALRGAQEEALATGTTDAAALGQLHSAEWAYAMAWGKYAEALRATREASRLFESIGDQRTLAVERSGEILALDDVGAYDEALALVPAALSLAQRLNLHFTVTHVHVNTGRALLGRGDVTGARRELTLAAEWLAPRSPLVQWPRVYLALCDLAEGDLDAAEGQVLGGVHDGGSDAPGVFGPMQGPSHACLARVELRRGNATEAVRRADLAHAALAHVLGAPMGEALVRRTYIDVHATVGDRASAERELDKASAIYRARALAIDVPAWRDSYLAEPDVAAVLTRAR